MVGSGLGAFAMAGDVVAAMLAMSAVAARPAITTRPELRYFMVSPLECCVLI
jgi:hypothetical protein